MSDRETRESIDNLSDILWWLESQEWMIQEWLMETRPDDFHRHPRYVTARERGHAFRQAAHEAHREIMLTFRTPTDKD